MPVTLDKLLGKPLLHKHKDSDISDFTVLDDRYVNVTGDMMTGDLDINGAKLTQSLDSSLTSGPDIVSGSFSLSHIDDFPGTLTVIKGRGEYNASGKTLAATKNINSSFYITAGTVNYADGLVSYMSQDAGAVIGTSKLMQITHALNGTIDTMYGLIMENYSTGTFTTVNGIYLQTLPAATTRNAIVTEDGNVIFNDLGDATSDFRVGGATNSDLLFVDASTDRVGIGLSTPAYTLDVLGTGQYTGAVTIGDATNKTLLTFNTERGWKFVASLTGGSTTLDLQALVNGKSFRILDATGVQIPFQVATDQTAGSNVVWLAQTGGKIMIGSTAGPSSDLSFGGDVARVIAMERRTTTGTGYDLYLQAGGVKVGELSKAGGSLILKAGINTGGSQAVKLQNALKTGAVSNLTIANGGSGYTAGDILTLTTGSGTATFSADTVNGSGTILTVTRINDGSGYSIYSSVPTTGGTGTRCVMNINAVDGTSDTTFTDGFVLDGYSFYSAKPFRLGTSGASVASGGPATIGSISSVLNPRNLDMVNLSVYASMNSAGTQGGGTYAQIDQVTSSHTTGTINWAQALKTSVVNSNAGTLSTSIGNWCVIENTSTGTTSTARPFETWVICSNAGGTIGTAQNINIKTATKTGTITNIYGINIETQTATTLATGIEIGNMVGSTAANSIALRTNTGLVTFNEGGNADSDFRVEGDTDANLFFTDASADKIGIGTSAPSYKFHVKAAAALSIVAENTTASSSTSGGSIGIFSNDGAANASGDRIGGVFFGGITTGTTIATATGITSFATENWSATAAGAYLAFETTAPTTLTRSVRMKLLDTGVLRIGTDTFAKNTLTAGDITLDNSSTDTPGIHFYYAANKNWAIDSNVVSTQAMRFVSDAGETGGAVRMSLTTTNLNLTTVDLYMLAHNIVLDTTTGTKIGTGTTQKLSFYGLTPIVQPTTAIAASTFVANTSAIVDDTATFDGYTIGQIVKALRNIGLLA